MAVNEWRVTHTRKVINIHKVDIMKYKEKSLNHYDVWREQYQQVTI